MRIALCFSGLMRTYEKCLPTVVTNIIDANPEHEFHTFIATWCERGLVDRSAPVTWAADVRDLEWVHTQDIVKYPLGVKSIRMDMLQGSEFMASIERAANTKFSARRNPEQSNLKNMLPMLFKIDQCHRLLCEAILTLGVNYDVVVKTRADIHWNGPMKFERPHPRTLYMPSHERWGPGALNDQFYYGDVNTMSYMHTMWQNLDAYYDQKQELHPETFYHDWIERAQINKIHMVMPYHLER